MNENGSNTGGVHCRIKKTVLAIRSLIAAEESFAFAPAAAGYNHAFFCFR